MNQRFGPVRQDGYADPDLQAAANADSHLDTPDAIYHLTTWSAWGQALTAYEPPSFASEGFIHCSTAEQIRDVGERYFAGQENLVLLEIEAARVEAEIRYEGGFPHIYGLLNRDAIVSATDYAS